MKNNELIKDVIEMMTDENIEKSLFDSGRTYGYNYEKNINLEMQYNRLEEEEKKKLEVIDFINSLP